MMSISIEQCVAVSSCELFFSLNSIYPLLQFSVLMFISILSERTGSTGKERSGKAKKVAVFLLFAFFFAY